MSIQSQMFAEQKDKSLFDKAREYAYTYMDHLDDRPVFPTAEGLAGLSAFEEPIPTESSPAKEVLDQLNKYGGPATVAHTGGRYYGFVTGGALPISLATKWLTDFWDQCGGLYLTSPVNAKIEHICQSWLREIFDLPDTTVAGFVSGTSIANLCGLSAARYRLLSNQGWDINQKGLNGAPPIKIIAHRQVHACITKALASLGFGRDNITWIDADDQGRIIESLIPSIDNTTLLILQAGNVNTGAFDPFDSICTRAREAGAWVHIDGAFGLWAGATKQLSYLTKGMNKATSWAVDGHKTLNTPYDAGIVLCADAEAYACAMQATGDYLVYSEHRDPMLYTPEMSKRSRALELWATMKYLGRQGIDAMVTGFHERAKQMAEELAAHGFHILNDVVFNQVLVCCDTDAHTKSTLNKLQQSGECWAGGSLWQEKSVIRISVCSWATTAEDITRSVAAFVAARE